jgi:hypothetical protein
MPNGEQKTMASDHLSPEAYGVLQALNGLGKIRLYEPEVERELTDHKLAENDQGRLIITKKGHEAADAMRGREIKRIQKNKKPRYLA